MGRLEDVQRLAADRAEARLAAAYDNFMPGAVTVKINGLGQARRVMEEFPAQLERKVLRGALSKAAAVGQRAAREEAKKHSDEKGTFTTLVNPVTGKVERIKYHKSAREKHLYESLGKRSRTKPQQGMLTVSVGDYLGGRPHGWLVEYGHRMVVGGSVERISGRQAGKAPRTRRPELQGAGRIVGQVPPHPWLSIAFDNSTAEMISVFENEVVSRAQEAASPSFGSMMSSLFG